MNAKDEEAIIKRIVKAYLFWKKEASSKMITRHIDEVGYGLRKPISARSLSMKMRTWTRNDKSGSWFRVTSETRKNETWWKLQ